MTKNLYRLTMIAIALLALSACSGSGDAPSTEIAANPLSTDIWGEPQVSFNATTLSVSEGESINVTISVSGRSTSSISVPFTISGTATSADYTITASPITIGSGNSSASILLTTVDNTIDEPNKTVVLTMGTPTNARVGAITVTTIVIADNDVTPGAILGRVINAASGAALPGVAASGAGLTATTSATGAYTLTPVPTSTSTLASFSVDGFASQSRTTPVFSNDFVQVMVNVPMVAVAHVDTYDPALARTISVPGTTAQLQVAAGSLRTAAAAMPTGMVTARVTPIGPGSNVGVLPGNYLAVSGSTLAPFESFGALDARFVDAGGNALDLATGSNLTVRIPVSTRSATLPATTTLFYFDAAAGVWRADGTATLQGTVPNRYYEATVTRASTTWTAGALSTTINVTGCVETASGAPLANAVVTAEGTDFTGTTAAVTNASGVFTVPVRANSNAFLQASLGTSISNSPPITTQTANMTLAPCLLLTPGLLSVKLTWGAQPLDLDSHTLGANSTDHIFYAFRGSLTQAPWVGLDVDDVNGNGPEVTTFTNLAQNRTYRFYVHNYSNTFTPGQTGSPARVEVTRDGFQTVFTPPVGETNQTRYWHVFDVTTDGNCIPTIVPVQQFTVAEPLNVNVGNTAIFCN